MTLPDDSTRHVYIIQIRYILRWHPPLTLQQHREIQLIHQDGTRDPSYTLLHNTELRLIQGFSGDNKYSAQIFLICVQMLLVLRAWLSPRLACHIPAMAGLSYYIIATYTCVLDQIYAGISVTSGHCMRVKLVQQNRAAPTAAAVILTVIALAYC